MTLQLIDLNADAHWNLGDLFDGMGDPNIDRTLTECLARAEAFEAELQRQNQCA